MKLKMLLSSLALGFLSASVVSGQGVANRFAYSPNPDTFTANEWSFDLFGFHGDRDKSGADKDAWGYGADFSYYLTRYFGVGAETYADAFEVPYLANGMALLRVPLGNSGFAPYGFGGGGRQWKYAAQWLGFVGGGLDFRLNEKMGIFGDARYLFPDKTPDYWMIRFGLRFVIK